MSEHLTRILIVDDRREVGRVLRTSLELLNRGYQITDVPSGEEALLECQRIDFDLLIADFRLPGMSGVELIQRARKRIPGLNAMIITGVPLYQVEKEVKGLDILGIFQKPLDPDAFCSRVDEILLGDTPVPAAGPVHVEPAAAGGVDPFVLERELSTLLTELGAQGVALINGVGKVLLKEGSFDASLRFNELSVMLASNFLTTSEIGTYLGNGVSGAVHYYSGKWYDVFALSAGKNHFLALVFPGSNQKQMGAVLRLGKSTAERIGYLLAADQPAPQNGKVKTQIDTSMPIPGAADDAAPRMSLVEEIRAQKRREAEEAARQVVEDEPTVDLTELLEDDGESSAIDLNFDDLDAELGDLNDFDGFWEQADGDVSGTESEAISRDDAVELGLLPNDLED